MPDKAESIRVVCEGGLDSTQNYLELSAKKPGCATRLVNYEVGLNGGYRRINGYLDYDTEFTEVGVGVAEGKILGLVLFENTVSGSTELYTMRKDIAPATTYTVYKYEFGTGWVAVVTGLTHNFSSGGAEVDKIRYDVGNDGVQNYLAFADGVNNATLFDGTTWVFIDSADTGADLAHAGGNQAIDAPTLVQFFGGSLFISYDTINNFTGLLAYSAPREFYKWTTAAGGGQVTAGMSIVDHKPFRSNFYIFGGNAIKKVTFDVTNGFLINDVTNNIGCVARDSVVEIGGDLVFLGPDGFRPVAGTDKIGDVQLESLSKPIHALIKSRLSGNAGLPVNTVVIRSKSQFRIFFGDDNTDASASKGIVAALRTADQETGWEFGELLGFRASCATSRYVNGEEVVVHGDYDGHVYREETGNSLNGQDMVSVYSTPYLDLGDTEIRKVFEKVNIFLQGEGDIGLNLNVNYDWGKLEIINPSNYVIELSGDHPMYDSGDLYDGGAVYGGVLTPISNKNVEGSFFSTKLTFTASGTDASHTIQSLVLEFIPLGRR
jgi:hypothetical protein